MSEPFTFQVRRYVSTDAKELPGELRYMADAANQRTTTVVRALGRTMDGSAVNAYIVGFFPYFYVTAPPEFDESHLASFKNHLELTATAGLRSLEIVRGKHHAMYYDASTPTLIKVCPYNVGQLNEFKKIWHNEARSTFVWNDMTFRPEVFEGDVQFHTRLSIDIDAVPYSWLEFPAGSYASVTSRGPIAAHCDETLCINVNDIIVHKPEGDYSKNAPLVTIAFDIECIAVGCFPQADTHPVSQIACVEYDSVLGTERPKSCVCFTTGDGTLDFNSPDEYRTIVRCNDEIDLFRRFRDYIVRRRPDYIVGYNSDNFDWTYLIDRSNTLAIQNWFLLLNWTPDKRVVTAENRFKSKARGASKGFNIVADWESCDMLRIIPVDHKLRSYTLDYVASEFLGDRKVPLPHELIAKFHCGTPEQQLLLWEYNIHDALLAARIFFRLKTLCNFIEMCRVTGVDVNALVTGGQGVKVHRQMLAWARNNNYVIPTRHRQKEGVEEDDDDYGINDIQTHDDEFAEDPYANATTTVTKPERKRAAKHVFQTPEKSKKAGASKAKYAGATVLKPIKGLYHDPVTTLDFSSLYPSIMIQHNLCYIAHIVDPHTCCQHGHNMFSSEEVLTCGCVEQTPFRKARFATSKVRVGMLPQILINLLAARSLVKRQMAAAEDPTMKQILDGRQLAIKISANSIYGFTGATVGKLPCVDISASVTAFGRDMIFLTKERIEKKYQGRCVQTSQPVEYEEMVQTDPDKPAKATKVVKPQDMSHIEFKAKVIYGDTDSVMILSGATTVAEAIAFGKHAADFINATFAGMWMTAQEKADFLAQYVPGFEGSLDDALLKYTDTLCKMLLKIAKSTVNILFEKVLWYYLLLNKKRYVGGFYLVANKRSKVHQSGIESVRRDNCPFVSELIDGIVKRIMEIDGNPYDAVQFANEQIQLLCKNKIPFSKLTLTRGYKDPEEYSAKTRHNLPHLIVDLKNRRRKPGSGAQQRDRVKYMMCITPESVNHIRKVKSKAQQRDLYEDPDWARSHGLMPDIASYLKAAERSTTRVFDTMFGDGATHMLLFSNTGVKAKPENSPMTSLMAGIRMPGDAAPLTDDELAASIVSDDLDMFDPAAPEGANLKDAVDDEVDISGIVIEPINIDAILAEHKIRTRPQMTLNSFVIRLPKPPAAKKAPPRALVAPKPAASKPPSPYSGKFVTLK